MDGNFGVRSAYCLIENEERNQDGECSFTIVQSKLWKAIWKMKVPHKICIFTWWACTDGLPCFQLLQQRHIPMPHNNCWSSFLLATSDVQQRTSFLQLVSWISSSNNPILLIKFFVICWIIWGRHNKKIYSDIWLDTRGSIEGALSYRTFFTTCHNLQPTPLSKLDTSSLHQETHLNKTLMGLYFFIIRS